MTTLSSGVSPLVFEQPLRSPDSRHHGHFWWDSQLQRWGAFAHRVAACILSAYSTATRSFLTAVIYKMVARSYPQLCSHWGHLEFSPSPATGQPILLWVLQRGTLTTQVSEERGLLPSHLWSRSEAAVVKPHSCCHTPDLTSLITSQVSLTTPSLTPSTLQASLQTDKINNQHGGGSRPGPD